MCRKTQKNFLYLVKNKLDIIFANEQEILSLIDSKSFDDVISFSKELNKNVVITRGEKGAVAIKNKEVFDCKAEENLEIIDLTGAGDLFAAGYLHGVINKISPMESLKRVLNFHQKLFKKLVQGFNF